MPAVLEVGILGRMPHSPILPPLSPEVENQMAEFLSHVKERAQIQDVRMGSPPAGVIGATCQLYGMEHTLAICAISRQYPALRRSAGFRVRLPVPLDFSDRPAHKGYPGDAFAAGVFRHVIVPKGERLLSQLHTDPVKWSRI